MPGTFFSGPEGPEKKVPGTGLRRRSGLQFDDETAAALITGNAPGGATVMLGNLADEGESESR